MDISLFEKSQAQLQALFEEMSTLSKKKPDDAVNKFKLRFINQVITTSNTLLNDEYIPFSDFDRFDEDDLPTNSDVVIILSQYLNCLEKLRADNIMQQLSQWYWRINGKVSDIRTAPPKKIQW